MPLSAGGSGGPPVCERQSRAEAQLKKSHTIVDADPLDSEADALIAQLLRLRNCDDVPMLKFLLGEFCRGRDRSIQVAANEFATGDTKWAMSQSDKIRRTMRVMCRTERGDAHRRT
jgi:hypothetical protein